MADQTEDRTIVPAGEEDDGVTMRMDDPSRTHDSTEDADVTMRIPVGERPKDGDTVSSLTGEIGHSTLALSSTRILNYLMGRKLRNVDDELDMISARSKAATQSAWDYNKVVLKKMDDTVTVCETIGEGGQGIVTRAYDQTLQRSVALKSLRGELIHNEGSRRSFISEALLTASLDHPAIIPVYSLKTDDEGGLHLAMKVLRGKSLKEHLSAIRTRYERFGISRFDENESLNYRLDIFLRVCETMAYVHKKGIIHCDLKPENIMIGEYRETYVVDWGIAERIDDPLPAEHKIMGTPRYTSPENLAAMKCDQRSDIYSLGVILFELVTLNTAFSGKDVKEVIDHVRRGQCNPMVHKFGAAIPADLAAIIRKAMDLEPGRRYKHTEELIDDLRRWMRGAEVSANPDGFFGRILRWSNHHRRLVLAGAALIALSSIFLSTIGFYAQLARNAEIERRQDGVINYAVSKMRLLKERGMVQLACISDMLKLLTTNAALLLDINESARQEGQAHFVEGNEVGKGSVPDQLLFSNKALGGQIVDVSHVSISTPWRNDPVKFQQFLRDKEVMRPIIPSMRMAVLQSGTGNSTVSSAEAILEYRRGELPVVFSYFCLKDGTVFCYPATAHMEGSYYGCERPWYRSAAEHRDRPVWSAPYRDSGEAGVLMTTCSMAMLGAKNEFYGVAAVDVPLTVLERQLCKNPELSAYILRRQIIDETGAVVVDIGSMDRQFIARQCGSVDEHGNLVFPRFRDGALLKQMRAGRYGSRITQENGKKILWLYSLIEALNWLYVEKIDLNALMHFPPAIR